VFPQYEDRVYICGFSLFVYGSRRRPGYRSKLWSNAKALRMPLASIKAKLVQSVKLKSLSSYPLRMSMARWRWEEAT